jgi:GTP cyclohydrolase II
VGRYADLTGLDDASRPGIGLVNKIRAYAIQERGYDTVEANFALGLPEDMREYHEAADMLRDLGVQQVRLLTNNPAKIQGLELERRGITVTERVALHVSSNASNLGYLETKRATMGHLPILSLMKLTPLREPEAPRMLPSSVPPWPAR